MKKLILLAAAGLLFSLNACTNCPSCPPCEHSPGADCGQPEPTVCAPSSCGEEADAAAADTTPIAVGGEEIALPKPTPTLISLTKALEQRRSVRAYSDKPISAQDVSNLLWSANGINRPDGKRTAPSARNKQSVTIYAAFEKGLYKYDFKAHKLVRLSTEDLRPVQAAPMELLFSSNLTSDTPESDPPEKALDFAAMRGIDAGTASQNAALYCAAAGLGTVIRMQRNTDDALIKALAMPANEHLLFNMAVGYEQKSDN